MSKQCPSVLTPGSRPSVLGHNRVWRGRVFHNSYTRNGRSRHVRGWSVKLQFQRQRRTVRLVAQTKSAAVAEARRIHQTLINEGWSALDRRLSRAQKPAAVNADPDFWKERLLIREHSFPTISRQREFSVRIDHASISEFFPLGETDPQAAAERALMIYRTVAEKGWPAAHAQFAREANLAFHWGYDPLLWTYTTVRTLLEYRPPSPVGAAPGTCRVFLLETDSGIRNSLAWCVLQHQNCSVVAWAGPASARRSLAAFKPTLCLFNSALVEAMGLGPYPHPTGALGSLAVPPGSRASSEEPIPSRLQPGAFILGGFSDIRLPGIGNAASGTLPVLTYSVHADSDQVFLAPPGGRSAYWLKRVAPERILEPLLGALNSGSVSVEALHAAAQSYFQRTFQAPAARSHPPAAPLTQREQEVLQLLSKGHVDKEIAQALGISVWTVHGHVKRVFEKLKVHSRIEAVLTYLQK